MVVGSGPAGIEQAGEIVHYFPNSQKKLTIVTRSSRLLANMPPKAGFEAEVWLKSKGAQIHFNTTYTPLMDKDYDVVIKTTG